MQQDIVNIKARVQSFWEWFAEMEDNIREFFTEEEMVDKPALVEAINNRVLDFGLFSWEIGPGIGRPYYFTISPNGSKERLRISKLIIEAAPNLPDWEFYYARPAKSQGLKFTLYDDFMVEREVDASSWKYALAQQPDNRIEIILEAANMHHLDPDTQLIAGERVVNNLLGEEATINHVYRVRVVQELEEEHQEYRAPIAALMLEIESIS
ncbi:MAG: hypothetical protein KDD19_24165 [Phaeodactylibacter sp.]|nr:hypothetical protein [Phaeodactylibacter sp.]MCB9051241.1 hypothetical protein [Lewinellaceae bacterium]